MPYANYAEQTGPANGTKTVWDLTFPSGYIDREYVYAQSINITSLVVTSLSFTWINDNQISISPAVASGNNVRIYRITPITDPLVDFQDRGTLSEEDLDLQGAQLLDAVQELSDSVNTSRSESANAAEDSSDALTAANSALAVANSANASVGSAVSIANAASANAATALSTANAANSTASGLAPSIATANTNASAAVTTANAASSGLAAHTANVSNPHSTTKAQVGLSAVDNTSDATKNSASATLTNKAISGTLNTLTNLPAAGILGVIPIGNLATGTPNGTKFVADDGTLKSIPGGGDALTANPLNQFAATTSAQLRSVITDETGSGAAVFADNATLTGVTATDSFRVGGSIASSTSKLQLVSPTNTSLDYGFTGVPTAGQAFAGMAGWAYSTGTTYVPAATINFLATQTWTSTAAGARVRVRTTPNNSLTLQESFSFDADGVTLPLDYSRIRANYSGALRSSRQLFQTIVANGTTTVGAIPAGTGTSAAWSAYNSADPDNASIISINAGPTSCSLIGGSSGTGTALPIDVSPAATVSARFGLLGQWGIGGANYGTTALGAKQSITSGGASAAPAWRTNGQYELVWDGAAFGNPLYALVSQLSCGDITGRFAAEFLGTDVVGLDRFKTGVDITGPVGRAAASGDNYFLQVVDIGGSAFAFLVTDPDNGDVTLTKLYRLT